MSLSIFRRVACVMGLQCVGTVKAAGYPAIKVVPRIMYLFVLGSFAEDVFIFRRESL